MKSQGTKKASHLVVSVESRKGGVGKTTAALCLGRVLRKRGYSVLVIDLDVTGTNAVDIVESPFWKEELHAIRDYTEIDHNQKVEPPPVNLLTLFERNFMVGKGIPSFSPIEQNKKGMRINFNKTNVLGSQIYAIDDEEGGKIFKKDKNIKSTCIEQPGILFDDLYSYWLLELIKQIISDFVRIARTNKQGKTAIVLDNSPGYVGISPAIQDMLTDSGPIIGKFLTVTSLDAQDLRICERALSSLHTLYIDKWKTSRLFVAARESDEEIEVAQNQESFFTQLATSTKSDAGMDDPLRFYKDQKTDSEKERPDEESGEIFCDQPQKYIAAIVNRVPLAIKIGSVYYDTSAIKIQPSGTLGKLLNIDKLGRIAPERMVPYDEYLENQFLQQALKSNKSQNERGFKRINRAIQIALQALENEIVPVYDVTKRLDRESDFIDLTTSLVRATDLLNQVRLAFNDGGLGHIARLIHDEWLPNSIITNFRSALVKILQSNYHKFLDDIHFGLWIDIGKISSNEKRSNFWKQFLENWNKSIDFSPKLNTDDRSLMVSELLTNLSGLTFFSTPSFPPYPIEVANLIADVWKIELLQWKKWNDDDKYRYSIQRFLTQSVLNEKELDEIAFKNQLYFITRSSNNKPDYDAFIDFFSACASAQARLMDYAADTLFLIRLMDFMQRRAKDSQEIFPFIRGIVEKVIIEKTVTHKEALDMMSTALVTAEYFKEFDRVLEKTVEEWGR